MSPSAFITKRETETAGPRWVVRYRLGGRGFKLVHAGSFKTLKDARARRDFVTAEISAGRDPHASLKATAERKRPRSFAEEAERWRKTRHDHSENTRRTVSTHLRRLLPTFGLADPHTIRHGDVSAWIGDQVSGPDALKASSVEKYVSTFRQILDFADVEPNPARDKRVKMPGREYEEPSPPTAAQVISILRVVNVRLLRPFIAIEQTGMALGEAAQLTWGDVDVPGCMFRLRRATVKANIRSRARWLKVDRWLMDLIEETCPPEDRSADRPVFQGFNPNAAREAMGRACRTAKIPHFHPHDLRHRRASLWHGGGVTARELAARLGHSKASMSLDVYSHVMPLDEVPTEQFVALVRERESAVRTSRREPRVRSAEGRFA